ncbi:MAG TPA: hypothetical protein VF171_02675 [Trueperaceae bacterium]
MDLPRSLVHVVQLPSGLVSVTLDRRGLRLEERGGFVARWADGSEEADASPLSPEDYRLVVRTHLREVYVAQEGQEPGRVVLNLASHQLLDDLLAWGRLNSGGR